MSQYYYALLLSLAERDRNLISLAVIGVVMAVTWLLLDQRFIGDRVRRWLRLLVAGMILVLYVSTMVLLGVG